MKLFINFHDDLIHDFHADVNRVDLCPERQFEVNVKSSLSFYYYHPSGFEPEAIVAGFDDVLVMGQAHYRWRPNNNMGQFSVKITR